MATMVQAQMQASATKQMPMMAEIGIHPFLGI